MNLIQTTTAALALAVLAPLASARHVNMIAQEEFQAMTSIRVQMIRPENGGSSHRPYVRRFRQNESRMARFQDRVEQNTGRDHGSESRRAKQAEKLAELLKIHQNLGGGNSGGGGGDSCPPAHKGNGGGPNAVPTPSAALAGLGGLGALALKRRRKG